jgi:hypothetical protein
VRTTYLCSSLYQSVVANNAMAQSRIATNRLRSLIFLINHVSAEVLTAWLKIFLGKNSSLAEAILINSYGTL